MVHQQTQSLAHSLAHSLSHSLAHSLTHSLIRRSLCCCWFRLDISPSMEFISAKASTILNRFSGTMLTGCGNLPLINHCNYTFLQKRTIEIWNLLWVHGVPNDITSCHNDTGDDDDNEAVMRDTHEPSFGLPTHDILSRTHDAALVSKHTYTRHWYQLKHTCMQKVSAATKLIDAAWIV